MELYHEYCPTVDECGQDPTTSNNNDNSSSTTTNLGFRLEGNNDKNRNSNSNSDSNGSNKDNNALRTVWTLHRGSTGVLGVFII